MSAPRPTGDRQKYLDAIVSFAGASQRRSLFRSFDIFTIKWSKGGLPEQCRFLLNTQLDVLEETQGRNSKAVRMMEIRALTEAH